MNHDASIQRELQDCANIADSYRAMAEHRAGRRIEAERRYAERVARDKATRALAVVLIVALIAAFDVVVFFTTSNAGLRAILIIANIGWLITFVLWRNNSTTGGDA